MTKTNLAGLTGIQRIAAERLRHTTEEGRTLDDDREHPPHTLARAALSYTLMATGSESIRETLRASTPRFGHWPWDATWWKPGDGDGYAARIRELEKAGSLLAAQIDVYIALEKAEAEWAEAERLNALAAPAAQAEAERLIQERDAASEAAHAKAEAERVAADNARLAQLNAEADHVEKDDPGEQP